MPPSARPSSRCRTAIVWSSPFEQVQVLEGHSQTVWAVKAVSPTQILTGSADKTILLWTKTGGAWKQTQKVRLPGFGSSVESER